MPKQTPKSDCFAFEQKSKSVVCNALNRLYCAEGKCSFYMSNADYEEKHGETYQATLKKLQYSKTKEEASDEE